MAFSVNSACDPLALFCFSLLHLFDHHRKNLCDISDNSDIGYINAHGTATNKGDTVETSSIKKVFGNTLPYVSSTKGATGHMMGAGGITETITCVKAIETGTVPPTINLNEVDPECAGIDFVANTAKKAEINFAMSNAFGFGGQNSSIIVGKYGK